MFDWGIFFAELSKCFWWFFLFGAIVFFKDATPKDSTNVIEVNVGGGQEYKKGRLRVTMPRYMKKRVFFWICVTGLVVTQIAYACLIGS